MLKHGILGLLNYNSMTGYEIKEVFENSLNYFWAANTSQIYRELTWIRDHGFATVEVIPQDGKPDKNVFTITEGGREELKNWLRAYDYGNNNLPLCMKTFFMAELPAEENIQRFQTLIDSFQERLRQLDAIDALTAYYQKMVDNKDARLYWKMTQDYGRRYLVMLIQWAENCIGEIRLQGDASQRYAHRGEENR